MTNTSPKSKGLIDSKIDVKVKLASLWASLMFLYIYCDFFDMMSPGNIESKINLTTPVGPVTPQLLVIFSLILIVPTLMICLSTLLKPRVNKWLNIIVAIVWSSMSFIILVWDIIDQSLPWSAFYDLFQLIEIVVFCIIVRTAWKWPKVEA
ncbi:DUF6326 family protein [Aquimarina sp. 2201CG1-2-11]|uniref:DUF6326 family protein n=1 Tax=Aquimarina discodermiae TaxID=3231043 RepID=UPI003461B22C